MENHWCAGRSTNKAALPQSFNPQNAPIGLSQITVPPSPSSPPQPQAPLLANQRYSKVAESRPKRITSSVPLIFASLFLLSLSLSLSLFGYLLLIALIPFYLAYIAETPLNTSILFPFRPIFVSCSEFSMAKDCFWEFN